MWPQALQMSKEECRGILRRLELESYSNVISVFRAQGGLSETKAKLLEELRNIFHITQERHRAEARRVANDEQLSTIAEAISGPNTWQEWSREGRRTFPMLPRVAPQTALALIANNIANEVASENAKLPYPAETGLAAAEEQAAADYAAMQAKHQRATNAFNVVSSDPFKMPEIPAVSKKNLKRNMNEPGVAAKKRLTNDKLQNDRMFNNFVKQNAAANQLTTPPSNIRKLYNSHTKQQQRHQQMQQQLQHGGGSSLQQQSPSSNKIGKQKAKAQKAGNQLTGSAANKRQITPAKVGRRSHKMQQHELQMQQQQQQQQQQQMQQQQIQPHQVAAAPFANSMPGQAAAAVVAPSPASLAGVDILGDIKDTTTSLIVPQPLAAPTAATTSTTSGTTIILPPKKDIPKIYTKLQQSPLSPNAGGTGSAARLIPLDIVGHTQTQPSAAAHHQLTSTSTHNLTQSPTGPVVGSTTTVVTGKLDKQNLISTPVQKYIVEDRQQQQTAPLSPVTATPHSLVSSAPQIMTLPQISGSSSPSSQITKLRTVNATTTILNQQQSAVKHQQLKKLTSTTTNAVPMQLDSPTTPSGSVLYNFIESSGGSGPNTPTHTAPAIIQLQSSDGNTISTTQSAAGAATTGGNPSAPATLSQGKVLTTKLMPIVLSGGSGSGATTTAAKLENAPSVPPGTIIKSLPASAMLQLTSGGTGTQAASSNVVVSSAGVSSGTGQLISTLAPGTTIFRKAGNIFKATKPANPGGPQIISNIKLTPVTHNTTAANTQSHTAFLKNITTTGLRTSVKICQSPNGKVFIQPANLTEASKAKIHSQASKLGGGGSNASIVNNISGGVGTGTVTTTATQPQRIAIQKVQIIPAPLNSPSGGGGGVNLPQKPTTLSLSNKTNMIFVPASAGNSGAAAGTVGGRSITISKSNLLNAKGLNSPQDPQAVAAAKANVVVIGTATTPKNPTILYEQHSAGGKTLSISNKSQLITEDTPVDILNMPIIVDGAECNDLVTTTPNEHDDISAAESLTVLAAEPQIQLATTTTLTAAQKKQQQQSLILLGATDWEMELDQAQAQQAKTRGPHPIHDEIVITTNKLTENSNQQTNVISNDTPIIIDHDNYQDHEHIDDDENIVIDNANSSADEGGSLRKSSQDDVIILEDDMKQNMLEEEEEAECGAATEEEEMQEDDVINKSNEDCYIVIDDKMGEEEETKQRRDRKSSTDSTLLAYSDHNNTLIESNDEDNAAIEYVKDEEEVDVMQQQLVTQKSTTPAAKKNYCHNKYTNYNNTADNTNTEFNISIGKGAYHNHNVFRRQLA